MAKQQSERMKAWEAATTAELVEINEKTTISFYGIAGMIIAVLGVVFGIFTDYYLLSLAIPLGLLVMGMGNMLGYMRQIANK